MIVLTAFNIKIFQFIQIGITVNGNMIVQLSDNNKISPLLREGRRKQKANEQQNISLQSKHGSFASKLFAGLCLMVRSVIHVIIELFEQYIFKYRLISIFPENEKACIVIVNVSVIPIDD